MGCRILTPVSLPVARPASVSTVGVLPASEHVDCKHCERREEGGREGMKERGRE